MSAAAVVAEVVASLVVGFCAGRLGKRDRPSTKPKYCPHEWYERRQEWACKDVVSPSCVSGLCRKH